MGAGVATSEKKRRRPIKRGDTPFDRFARDLLARRDIRRITGLRGAAPRVAASHLIRAHGEHPVLYITAHSRAIDSAVPSLQGLLGEREESSRLRVFPAT